MIEAYTIGIHLAVTNNVGAAVGQINGAMRGLNTSINAMGRQMHALSGIMAGHAMVRAGDRILGGLEKMVVAGAELNTEFTRTMMLGGQLAAHASDMRRDVEAWSKTIPGWDKAQLMSLDKEVSTQVGYDEAKQLVPMLAKLGSNISFATGGKDGGPEAILGAYRSVEAVGGAYSTRDGKKEFDPEKFERYMNALQGSLVASGGLVSIKDLTQATRQGGPSLRGMEPEVLFPYLAELGIQMGASRAGTASMSFAAQFAGGIMTRRTAQGMQGAGLLGSGEYDVGRGGSIVLHDEARRRLAEALKDPPKWVRDILMPKMEGKSNTEVISVLMGMFGRQTTQRLMADLEQNNPQFWRMRENAAAVPGVAATNKAINDTSITAGITNLDAAWKSFQQTLVETLAPVIIPGLHALTEGLKACADMVTAHPQAALYLTGFAAALGGFLVVAGSATMITAPLALLKLTSALAALSNLPLAAAGGEMVIVGNGLSAIAGVTGLATLGGVLLAVGGALGVLVAAVKGFTMSPAETDAAQKRLQDLGLSRNSTAPSNMPTHDMPAGRDPVTGAPISYNGVSQAPRQEMHVRISGSVPIMADGRTIAAVAGERLTAMLSQAPRGPMAPDPSISPIWGAQLA